MPTLLSFYYLCQTNPQKIMEILRSFYHPDHLGSTSWITDRNGDAIQYLHYLPLKSFAFFPPWRSVKEINFLYAHCLRRFGEEWIDQRSTSWNAQYSFTGKIKDAETGYNYFGARYYDSGLSLWLSVDPLSDKYPTLSPYTYCANNPIMMVDPDGRYIMLGSLMYTVGMNTTSGFEGKVITALNNLCTGSGIARTMITYLAYTPSYTLNIQEGGKNIYDGAFELIVGNEFYEQGKEGTINMAESSQGVLVQGESGSYGSDLKENFTISLFHEISHAFHHAIGDYKVGNTDYGSWGKIPSDEVQATNDENQVRSEMGHRVFRTHYFVNHDPQTGRYSSSGPCLINIDRNSGVISSSDPTLRNPLIYYTPKRRQ